MSQDGEADTDFDFSDSTGPFCRHWGDPADCDFECTKCGHRCTDHVFEAPGECRVDGCACTEWVGPT